MRSLVNQLKRFGKRLLAEKVESVEQLTLCQSLGFDLFQGYYFARPMLPGDVEAWARLWTETEPEPLPLALTGRSATRRA